MAKKTKEVTVTTEDVIYVVAKWTRVYKNNATLDGKSYSVRHECVLSEINDGHWEYTDHVTQTEDGTDRSMSSDLVITNAESDPSQLKEFQEEPWQMHFIYSAPEVVIRAFEKKSGSWTALDVAQFNENGDKE